MLTGIVDLMFDLSTVLLRSPPILFNCFAWFLAWLPYVFLCGIVPSAIFWWVDPEAANSAFASLYALLWTGAGAAPLRLFSIITPLVVNSVRRRCFHFSTCTCFDGCISVQNHREAVIEAEAILTGRYETQLKTPESASANNGSPGFSSGHWRQRAEAAEELVAACRKDHFDRADLFKANKGLQNRVADLKRENGDLRIKYNLERKNKGRHPLFEDLPSNLEERNLDLQREIEILRADLKAAQEEQTSLQSSRDEKAMIDQTLRQLKSTVAENEGMLDTLRAQKENLENFNRIDDTEEKRALRRRIFKLLEQLRDTTVQRDAFRISSKKEVDGDGDSDNHGGAIAIAHTGNPNCIGCISLRKSNLDAEYILKEAMARIDLLQNACDDNEVETQTLRQPVEQSRQEVVRSRRPQPPQRDWSTTDAASELTHIYDRLKEAMVKVKEDEFQDAVNWDTMKEALTKFRKADPEGAVGLNNVNQLIDLIPHLFRCEKNASRYQAELLAALQEVEMFAETIKSYNSTARDARQTLDPGTAIEPDYDIIHFVANAVDIIDLLNTKLEQQRLFNRSTLTDKHEQLESLQSENIHLNSKLGDLTFRYNRAMKEVRRLRTAVQTQAMNSRRPEDKRLHAVHSNLKAVFHEMQEFMVAVKMSHPEFTLPAWVESLYLSEDRNPNKLPSRWETDDIAHNLRQIIIWMQEEGCLGPNSSSHHLVIEGAPPSIDHGLRQVLQPLMERANLAVEEVEIFNEEIKRSQEVRDLGQESGKTTPEDYAHRPDHPSTLQNRPIRLAPRQGTGDDTRLLDRISTGTFADQMNRHRDRSSRRSGLGGTGVPMSKGHLLENDLDAGWSTGSPIHTSAPYIATFGPQETVEVPSSYSPIPAPGRGPPAAPKTPNLADDSSSISPPPTNDNGGGNPFTTTATPAIKSVRKSQVLSPFVSSPEIPQAETPHSDRDSTLIEENPQYWRSGDRYCKLFWADIQGLQAGLRANGIDVTKYEWLSETIQYIDAERIDALRPQEGSGMSLVETQGDALHWQRNALEFEVWEKNKVRLGNWDDSPWNPANQPPKRLTEITYKGEPTGWERGSVKTGWDEIQALRTELRRNNIRCRDIHATEASNTDRVEEGDIDTMTENDINNICKELIGRKMTTADVLRKQLDFVNTQLFDLYEIWEGNVSVLGPRTALPFYKANPSSRDIAGPRSPQHEWRNDNQCTKLWYWMMGVQRQLTAHRIEGWKRLKKWEVDSCEKRGGETILESQIRCMAQHIQRLQHLWFQNQDVLGEVFTFQNRATGCKLMWPTGALTPR